MKVLDDRFYIALWAQWAVLTTCEGALKKVWNIFFHFWRDYVTGMANVLIFLFWTIPYSTCSVLLKFWIFPHLGPIELYFYFLPMPWKSNALQKFEPNFEETWQPFILWQAAAKSTIWKCMKTNAYCVTISKTLFIINLNFCSCQILWPFVSTGDPVQKNFTFRQKENFI